MRERPSALERGLSAIGDPTRLAILIELEQESLDVDGLAARLDVSRVQARRQVRILVDAGLVVEEDEAGFRVAAQGWRDLASMLNEMQGA